MLTFVALFFVNVGLAENPSSNSLLFTYSFTDGLVRFLERRQEARKCKAASTQVVFMPWTCLGLTAYISVLQYRCLHLICYHLKHCWLEMHRNAVEVAWDHSRKSVIVNARVGLCPMQQVSFVGIDLAQLWRHLVAR